MNKNGNTGHVLQIVQFVILLVFGLVSLVFRVIMGPGASWEIVAFLFLVYAVLFFIFTSVGKTRKWGNVVTLIMSIPLLMGGIVFGLCGLLGSIFSMQKLDALREEAKTAPENAAADSGVQQDSSAASAAAERGAQAQESANGAADTQHTDAPVSTKQLILDKDSEATFTFENAEGTSFRFSRLDSFYSDLSGRDTLYAVLERDGAPDEVYIAEYKEEEDELDILPQEYAERLFAEWQKGLDTRKDKLVLDLYDTIVYKSEWKQFRKSATQEELAVIAIGSKYNLSGAKFFVKAGISVIGTILSIVLGIALFSQFGLFSLFILVGGYLVFNLMASKLVGYSDTYNSCYRKLSKDSRAFVNGLFRENIAATIFREIVLIALTVFTLPYKFILIIIETLIPSARNWTVAHGGEAGAVISLPKGFDVGGLGALGEYYASCSFGDALDQHIEECEKARLAKFSAYEYVDSHGVTREAYSDDGKTFYSSSDKLTEVGKSDDGGKTIRLN